MSYRTACLFVIQESFATIKAAVVQWNHACLGVRSARVRILSTVRVLVGFPHSGQRFPSGWVLR
ncbi:hypothetical protein E2C01_096112 [Portunus trituberculatus]|uniref:Uncharacterized protein n=1 Tax=Portunus trituberculatus TaxID=210409 RepID=A0A5B7K273_PORTR|nr:hypothetical protein [Portunus trituberculatus]